MISSAESLLKTKTSYYNSSTSSLLLFLAANVLLLEGTRGDGARYQSSRGPIAVEISRGSRHATSASKIALNRRRLSSAEAKSGVLDVEDCENAEYSGRIGLGTPAQEFEVVLDTGSYTLWVSGAACSDGCEDSNKYDSSVSTTYEADGTPFTQIYEDGSEATGVLSVDVLSVGGLTTKATFGEMTTRSLDGCKTVDGVMGMGLSKSGNSQNAFETLVDAGVVDVPIFSFFMGNIDTETPTGVLTLGGVNQTHYEDCLQWVQIAASTVDGYWSIDLTDLKLGQDSALRTRATAILDTGTSMVVGPYDDVGYVADQIGGWCVRLAGSDSSTVEEVDCLSDSSDVELILMPCSSGFDDLTFVLGWKEFALTASEMLLPLTDFGPANPSTATDPWCVFGMMGHDEDLWILGDSFLRTFYTAYDVQEKKVGLAKATVSRTGETCSDDTPISAAGVQSTSSESPVFEDGVQPTPPPVSSLGGTHSTSSPVKDSATSSTTTATTSTTRTTQEAAASSTNPISSSDDATDGEVQNVESGGDESETQDSDSDDSGDEPNPIAVAATASLLTLVALVTCCGIGLLVHRRIRRGKTHRHTPLGGEGGPGGLEMSGKGSRATGAGGEIVVTGAEDDFLQARPGGYRGSGSGSHRYRVAAATEATTNGGSRGASGVTVLGGPSGADDDEEDDDDDVVEVDFGVSNNEAGAGTPIGRLGRMFGRGRAGFTAFLDGEESGGQQQHPGQTFAA